MSAAAIPVLMYHHVSPNPGLVTVSPATFEAHMRYLAESGYTTLTADTLLAFLTEQTALPAKSVLITFDDGYLDNYVYAFPVLQRYGLHAVIFAVTSWIGDGPMRAHANSGQPLPTCPDHRGCKAAIAAGNSGEVMLRWSEIETMASAGTIEIHSHTHTHTRWDKQGTDTPEKLDALRADLDQSQSALEHRLGRRSRHLCWPQGYYEAGYLQIAQDAGFHALYTTSKRLNAAGSSPLEIGRIVTKDRTDAWLAQRLWLYSRPLMAWLYTQLRGK